MGIPPNSWAIGRVLPSSVIRANVMRIGTYGLRVSLLNLGATFAGFQPRPSSERARRSFQIVKAQFVSQRGAAVPVQRDTHDATGFGSSICRCERRDYMLSRSAVRHARLSGGA